VFLTDPWLLARMSHASLPCGSFAERSFQ
jgi:hypothetical protein